MEDFHVGPFTTAVGDGELLTEVRLPLRPGAGSAHEKVERRAGDWAIAAASAALWIDGRHDRRRGHRAQRRRDDDHPPDPGRGAAARQAAVGGAVRAGAARSPPRTARRAPTAAGRSTTSATSPACSPNARCAARPRAPCTRRPDHERVDDRQRRAGLPRRGAAPAARALHPRDARPDRHPLGLRHLQLRRLRGADGRRAGEVVHHARGDVRRATRSARSSRWRSTASWTRSSRASTSATRCSAGSARRGC